MSIVFAVLLVVSFLVSAAAAAFFCRRCFVRKSKGAGGARAELGTGQLKAVNDVIAWVFSHPHRGVEEWADVLSRALTQQAAKNESLEDFQIRVQKISVFESAPPQISNLSTQRLSSEKSLVIRAEVLWKRFELVLSLTPRPTARGALYSIDCHVFVYEFHATTEGVLSAPDNVTILTAKFPTEPKMRLEVEPNREVNVDIAKLERLVRNTISGTEFRFPLTAIQNRSGSVGIGQPERFELQSKTQAAFAADESSPNGTRKLLVKILKANGLVASQERDYGSHQPFCVAVMDAPVQRYVTSSVQNTSNPFFDEQFVFDLDQTTKKLTFELHDKDRPEDDDFLGMAVLTVDDFSRNRHVLPLTGKGPMTFGALTVEVTVIDSTQVPSIMATSHNVQHIVPPAAPVVFVSGPDASTPLPSLGTPTRTEEDPTSRDSKSPSRIGTLPPKGDVKKRSLVSAIKKRFQRKKADSRSQSADRAHEKQQQQPALGEGIYLTPPLSRASANTEYEELPAVAGTRSRSNSLRSGFRRLFRRKHQQDSPTTLSGSGGFEHSPEGSIELPSPRLGSASSIRQSSPQPSTSGLTSAAYEQQLR